MSQKKKLIGVPGFLNSEGMFGVTGNYMQFASKYGNVRIIMPHEEHVEVDLLLLPGGLDLKPSTYKQIPNYKTTNHDVFKQFFFEERLGNYIEAGTPMFGICLGFQMINVALGGSLKQHLIWHPQSSGRWADAHEVDLVLEPKVEDKFQTIKVNSHHHQAVMTEGLAEELIPIATYNDSEGVIVEAFINSERKIGGVNIVRHSQVIVN